VEAPTGGIGRADGQIRLAAVLAQVDVERIGAKHVRTVVRLEWDEQLDDLWATTERVLDALVLDVVRGPAPPGPDTTTALVAHAVKTGLTLLGLTPIARSFQARVGWARRALGEDWPDLSDAALGARANEWLEPLRRGRAGDLIWPV
jgi:ATP-dependent helicase HrpB